MEMEVEEGQVPWGSKVKVKVKGTMEEGTG